MLEKFNTGRASGLVVALLLMTAASACNDKPWGSRECHIDEDQRDSFMARVGEFPIPLLIDSTFTSSELKAVEHAVAQWNGYGRQLIEGDFFTQVSGGNYEATAPNISDCGQNVSGTQNALILQNETNETRWDEIRRNKSGAGNTSVGVTFRCTVADEVQRQVTVLNARKINATQLSSVVLHELGHGLGLDHSCNNGGGSGSYRSCGGLSVNHPYRLAIMFPTLQLPQAGNSWTEIKDHVQSNDMDRLQCLYGPK